MLVKIKIFMLSFLIFFCPVSSYGQEKNCDAKTLESALENIQPNMTATIQFANFSVIDGKREYKSEKTIRVFVKQVEGRFHILGKFSEPLNLRGTAFLSISPPSVEIGNGDIPSNQYLIYLPAFSKVRRVAGSQRGDSFFGTEVSQGDMEIHPAGHYKVEMSSRVLLAGEDVCLIVVQPLFEAGYTKMFLYIGDDKAILRYEQYRGVSTSPSRVIYTKRDWLQTAGGLLLPSKLVAYRESNNRQFGTEIRFIEREIDPIIDDSLFLTTELLKRK